MYRIQTSVSILRTEEKECKAGIPDCILIVRKRKEKKWIRSQVVYPSYLVRPRAQQLCALISNILFHCRVLRGLTLWCQGISWAQSCIATVVMQWVVWVCSFSFHSPYLPFLVSCQTILTSSCFILCTHSSSLYIRVIGLCHWTVMVSDYNNIAPQQSSLVHYPEHHIHLQPDLGFTQSPSHVDKLWRRMAGHPTLGVSFETGMPETLTVFRNSTGMSLESSSHIIALSAEQ